MAGRGTGLAIGLVIGLLIGAALSYALLSPMTGGTSTTTSATTITSVVTSTATVSLTPSTSTAAASSTSSSTSSQTTGVSSTPSIPPPVAVSLDPKTTAVLVLDYVFCYRSPGCNATLPAIQGLLGNARSAGALVIFTRAPVPKEIVNQTGEMVITNDVGPDKYYNTSLASVLQAQGIKTLVVLGIAANGALLYTAQESCVRKYTVVVPADTVVGSSFVQTYVQYQLLNGPGCSNANNTPLKASGATLSSTSAITFKPAG
jgi:hypothetical protein